ncbi:MAG: TonB-dependent siderophore myxochelin receptor MxcH [Polyangiaceae bacterium]
MPFRASHRLALTVSAHLLLVASPVLAQPSADGPKDAAPSPGELRPPELLESVVPDYPDAARAERLEGVVQLRVDIDASGNVVGVEVLEAAGHGFDEAAQAAVRKYRFKPAERGGQPIPSRIRLSVSFHDQAQQASAPEAPTAPAPAAEAPTAVPPAVVAPAVVAPPRATEPTRGSGGGTSGPGEPTDVRVRGHLSEAERLQQSAEAVNVIDLRSQRQQTADMGEVMARTQGVAVRRDGGLGSNTRFSLNGLYDDQIRFFLDGVPLPVAGYPFGIADVPVNLIQRVEVYRGVVPIRFGADALGGGINLVSNQDYETRLAASYQVASYGVHRATLEGRYRHEPSGAFVGGSAYLDVAKNNYPVDVEIPDEEGQLSPHTVPRFHDRYRSYGAMLEAGVVERPWAKRLLVKGFAASYHKELQHNIVMTVPYGGVSYGEAVKGATGRYEGDLGRGLELELVGSYAHRTIDFVDKSNAVYDWYGRRVRERRVAGELEGKPRDQLHWEHRLFGRAYLSWKLGRTQVARLSLSPAYTTRTGDERMQPDPTLRDPLSAKRKLFTFVAGLEYELNAFEDRLSNIVFVKDYVYAARTEEHVAGNVFRERNADSHTRGIGDSLRFRFTPYLYAKASYEHATRLPRPDEVFGNGMLIVANLELQPEVSHNANLGPRLELKRTRYGDFTLDVNAFLRARDRLIVLLGNDRYYSYQNVYQARGLGLENLASWTSPGRRVTLDGMLTWQDERNSSDQGTFGDFKGDRIPNRPYLFGSWGARYRFNGFLSRRDSLEPFYGGRYVHSFFRGWESVGLRQYKQVIEAQVTHNLGVTWNVDRRVAGLSWTFEIDNLTDAKVFDNFGIQRPGRSFAFKLSGEI